MRKTFISHEYTYELLDRRESLVEFPNVGSATEFLARFKDKTQIELIRDLVLAHSEGRETDESIILKKFAELLVAGKVRLLKTPSARVSGAEEASGQKGEQGQAGSPPSKKSWIEIDLVDGDGKPVAGASYRLKLPDGLAEEGKLDAYGHTEYYEINPGTCELTFPDFDAKEWESA